MKRKNASISNADILYNYVHNNCPRRFFIDFYGVSSILSTLFMLCGQIVDKLSSVDKFIIFSIFNNSLFYKGLRGYLPQQFLYFFPLPHGHGSFLPTLFTLLGVAFSFSLPSLAFPSKVCFLVTFCLISALRRKVAV